jgi:hypothetical protein
MIGLINFFFFLIIKLNTHIKYLTLLLIFISSLKINIVLININEKKNYKKTKKSFNILSKYL